MLVLLYTDTDQIRSTLQLTVEDIPDSAFNEFTYVREMMLDLASWVPNHVDIILAGVAPGATSEEVLKGQMLMSYCTYFCAYQFLVTTPFSVPQNISDGKNSVQRFSPEGMQTLRDFISGKMQKYKEDLSDVLNNTVTVPLTKMFVRVVPAYNPVTGQ